MIARVLAKMIFVACAYSCLISPAMASDGSSGCGPGWYVFKQNSLVSSSLRMTTNGILWPSVTVGMTLGTSNCAKHSIVQRSHRSLHFATYNRDSLMVDMAQGQGETLSAFAATWGCSWTSTERFGAVMQANYRQIFPHTDSRDTIETAPTSAVNLNDRIAGAIVSDPVLLATCQAG